MHSHTHILTPPHAQEHTRSRQCMLTHAHKGARALSYTCILTQCTFAHTCARLVCKVCARVHVLTRMHMWSALHMHSHTYSALTCARHASVCTHVCMHPHVYMYTAHPCVHMHTHARALMHMCKAHMQMHTHMCESTCTQLTSTCVHAHTCMCMRECAPGGLPCSSPSTSRGAGPPGSGTGTELCAEWSPDQPPPERAGRGRLLEETGVPPAPGGPRHSAPPAQEGCENTDSGPGVRWAMERGTQHPERTRPLLPTSVRPFRPGAGPRRLRSAPPLPRVDAAAALGLAVAQLCSGPF